MSNSERPPRHRQLAQEIAERFYEEFENVQKRGVAPAGGLHFDVDVPSDLSGARIRVSVLVAEVKLK